MKTHIFRTRREEQIKVFPSAEKIAPKEVLRNIEHEKELPPLRVVSYLIVLQSLLEPYLHGHILKERMVSQNKKPLTKQLSLSLW